MIDFFKIFIMTVSILLCCSTRSFAATVNSLEINPVNNSFQIVVNSNEPIAANTKKINNGEIQLTLKNIDSPEKISVIYNSSKVDNVLVKSDNNKAVFIIKAPEIANAKISGNIIEKNTPNNNNITFTLLSILLGIGLCRKIGIKSQKKISKTYKSNKLNELDFILNKTNYDNNTDEEIFKIAA